MPQIPTLTNQVRPEAAPNIEVRPLQNTVAQSVGAGLSEAGAAIDRIQREERLKADRAAFMDADRHTDTVANDLLTSAQALQGKDAIGSAPKLLGEFDKAATDTEATLTSSRSKAAYRQSVNARRAQLQRALDNHEGQQREAYYAKSREDFKDQAYINALSQYQDPSAIEGEIEKIRSAVDQTPGMDEAQKATELGVRRSGIYTGVVQRYLANDNIAGAERFYMSVKDRVNGDKAAFIENAITDAKRIAEARARAKMDHAEAIAERTMNEIDRQIASGVPATPEMWAGWENKVRGTSFAEEFKARLDDEREAQELLRKPIGEQIREVQARKAALESGGGNLRQAANAARLERVVKQNLALIQNAPLIYGEQRFGDSNTPIDITSIVDPEQRTEVSQILQDRGARIAGLQRTLGGAVPMKPLLPNEAGQLVATLDRASPQQASQIFSALAQASGTPEIFKGAMAQIAPDAPVKAFAGLLASNQRELVTGNNWFSPDPFVKSTDVSATLLRGDRLLNPDKNDRAEDGKPKTSRLLLPSEAQAQLQTQFAKEVGTAFAGRPEVADRAYQAVQAYYVGRAAEQGKLAENSQTVDRALVKEAVRATLGNVVDYNDSQVLAPWGMATDDFENRIERAFKTEAKRLNLPENISPDLSTFGLMNTDREGIYGVSLNNKLLLNPDGSPVTLNIREEPVRGVIRR